MAKIVVSNGFSLEVGEDTFTGVFFDLTKSEQKEYKKKIKKLKNLKDRTEQTYRIGLEMRVQSEDKDAILKLGEDYGHEMVYKTILLDILTSSKKKENG